MTDIYGPTEFATKTLGMHIGDTGPDTPNAPKRLLHPEAVTGTTSGRTRCDVPNKSNPPRAEPETVTVHRVHESQALCRFTDAYTKHWPQGHTWVTLRAPLSSESGVPCVECALLYAERMASGDFETNTSRAGSDAPNVPNPPHVEPEKVTVHRVDEGEHALCAFSPSRPAGWPPGHKYVPLDVDLEEDFGTPCDECEADLVIRKLANKSAEPKLDRAAAVKALLAEPAECPVCEEGTLHQIPAQNPNYKELRRCSNCRTLFDHLYPTGHCMCNDAGECPWCLWTQRRQAELEAAEAERVAQAAYRIEAGELPVALRKALEEDAPSVTGSTVSLTFDLPWDSARLKLATNAPRLLHAVESFDEWLGGQIDEDVDPGIEYIRRMLALVLETTGVP